MLVTGGARRLGAAITESFAHRGYRVMIHHGHSPDESAALAHRLERDGAEIEVTEADLGDQAAPGQIVEETIARFGALDVLCSSASSFERAGFDAVTGDQWDRTMAVNLRAPFFLMQAAARVMSAGGCIVQLSDHLAFEHRSPSLIAHQISKYALGALVRTVAAELAPRIRVNAVAPGIVLPPPEMSDAVRDAMLEDVPMGAVGQPSDVIAAIHFLVDAPYVTGTTLRVDGGRHLWT